MFDLVHKHKRLLQIMLALVIVPPFALWGIQWTQREASAPSSEVAEVGDLKITNQEFSNQLRAQMERVRSILGGRVDPAMFDTPQAREELLDGMISQRLLTRDVIRKRLASTDDMLREVISSMPAFQENGKFSRARYEQALQAEGYSPVAFEQSVRRDLLVQQLGAAVAEANIVSRSVAKEFALLAGEQREIAQASLPAAKLAGEVKVTPEAVQAFYEANKKNFEVAEQARVQYVVLNADAIAAAEPIKPEDIKKAYEARRDQFEQKEQRSASHILVTVKPNAGEADKNAARQKAADLAAQAKKNPGGFAELAKKNSEDPGSAPKGGELGFFSRGMMVPQFEDAVFKMQKGEIAGPVESDFGFHVIRLNDVRPGKVRSLEEVRGEIEKELRKQQAGRRFAEAAEQFANIVYEQPDSLQPVAEKFKLTVQDAGWVTRNEAKVQALNNPKLLAALFSDESLKNGRNTEAVEVAPGTLVAARAVEHRPATLKPLQEVRAEVERQLVRKEAAALAWKQGAELLAKLRKGEQAGIPFSASRTIGRQGAEDAKDVPPQAVQAAFRASRAPLPSYEGIELPEGYMIVRVSKVIAPALDEAKEKGAQTELARALGTSQLQAYVAALRADTKVKINKEALNSKRE